MPIFFDRSLFFFTNFASSCFFSLFSAGPFFAIFFYLKICRFEVWRLFHTDMKKYSSIDFVKRKMSHIVAIKVKAVDHRAMKRLARTLCSCADSFAVPQRENWAAFTFS